MVWHNSIAIIFTNNNDPSTWDAIAETEYNLNSILKAEDATEKSEELTPNNKFNGKRLHWESNPEKWRHNTPRKLGVTWTEIGELKGKIGDCTSVVM